MTTSHPSSVQNVAARNSMKSNKLRISFRFCHALCPCTNTVEAEAQQLISVRCHPDIADRAIQQPKRQTMIAKHEQHPCLTSQREADYQTYSPIRIAGEIAPLWWFPRDRQHTQSSRMRVVRSLTSSFRVFSRTTCAWRQAAGLWKSLPIGMTPMSGRTEHGRAVRGAGVEACVGIVGAMGKQLTIEEIRADVVKLIAHMREIPILRGLSSCVIAPSFLLTLEFRLEILVISALKVGFCLSIFRMMRMLMLDPLQSIDGNSIRVFTGRRRLLVWQVPITWQFWPSCLFKRRTTIVGAHNLLLTWNTPVVNNMFVCKCWSVKFFNWLSKEQENLTRVFSSGIYRTCTEVWIRQTVYVDTMKFSETCDLSIVLYPFWGLSPTKS